MNIEHILYIDHNESLYVHIELGYFLVKWNHSLDYLYHMIVSFTLNIHPRVW